jgi:hypothetical protein
MTVTSILALLKYLPLMLELAKQVKELIEMGFTEIQIREAWGKIDKAFQEEAAKDRARRLNDVFKI